MEGQMLRAVLKYLERQGKLKKCPVKVEPRFELGAVLSYYNNEQPVLFNNVAGSRLSVAGGLYGNRELIYELMETACEERIQKLMNAIARPGKPVLTETAPVQEQVKKGNIDILKMLPVPTSNEHDSGPFITAGMFIYRDVETGRTHAAVRRMQVNKGGSVNILVSPASPKLLEVIKKYKEMQKTLECAVILGYDPYLLLASQVSSDKYGLDTYGVDCALRGEPLELVKCKTVGLEAPAHAEIILEGVIKPYAESMEGPFAELMGYYSTKEMAPVMEVNVITSRKDAIYQHCFPCKEEHLAYGMIKEAEIYAALRSHIDVKDVNFTIGGGFRLHVAVSIHKRLAGDGKSAILTVLGNYKDVKHVIVVDDDVDIYNPIELEEALASRFQASRDLVVIAGALGSPLEPSYFENGSSDKMGFDATKPLGSTQKNYERAVIPEYGQSFDIHRYIQD